MELFIIEYIYMNQMNISHWIMNEVILAVFCHGKIN